MTQNLRQKTVNGLFWSSIERLSTQSVNFVLGLIIARLLLPDDYGILAMLAIFMAVLQVFVDSGFSSALVRKVDRTESDNSTVFYFNIIVGLFVYTLLFFSAPFIAEFYKLPVLTPVTRVVAVTVIFNSFCVVQQALLTSRIDFKTQAKISFFTSLLSGLIGVGMAYRGYGVWALVAQLISVALLRMILLWSFSKWRPQAPFSKQSFKELFSFGSKLLASGLLDTIYTNMYTIVIGKLFNVVSLGLYSRATQFAQFPALNVTGIIHRVAFPVLSSIQDEDERLRNGYRKIIRLSGLIVFPLMIGLAVVAHPLIEALLTDKWIDCVIYMRIICLAMMWLPIHTINLTLLQVKGRSDLFLKLEVVKKIIGAVVLCSTIPMGLLAMCYGQVVVSLISLIINTHYTGKLIQVGFLRQMSDLLPSLLKSLIVGLLSYLVMLLFVSSVVQVIVAILTGGITYYLLLRLTSSEEWKYIIECWATVKGRK